MDVLLEILEMDVILEILEMEENQLVQLGTTMINLDFQLWIQIQESIIILSH